MATSNKKEESIEEQFTVWIRGNVDSSDTSIFPSLCNFLIALFIICRLNWQVIFTVWNCNQIIFQKQVSFSFILNIYNLCKTKILHMVSEKNEEVYSSWNRFKFIRGRKAHEKYLLWFLCKLDLEFFDKYIFWFIRCILVKLSSGTHVEFSNLSDDF